MSQIWLESVGYRRLPRYVKNMLMLLFHIIPYLIFFLNGLTDKTAEPIFTHNGSYDAVCLKEELSEGLAYQNFH